MNKEEIIKVLTDKSKRYEHLIDNNVSFNDDEFVAYHTLNFINKITSQLSKEKEIKNKIRELANEYKPQAESIYNGDYGIGIKEIRDKLLSLLGDE